MQRDTPRLISIGAAAEALGVSPSALRKWEGLGAIPSAPRLGGAAGDRYYTETDLEALRLITTARRRQRQQTESVA